MRSKMKTKKNQALNNSITNSNGDFQLNEYGDKLSPAHNE